MQPIISRLGITQDHLRKPEQIAEMVEFVKAGGKFTQDEISKYLGVPPTPDLPIELAQFPDHRLFVHNGHHRVVAMHLGGRTHLYQGEYYVKYWRYIDYNDIVFLNPDGTWRGYVTPFDIKSECRLPDFVQYKLRVKDIYYEHGAEAATEYIKSHPSEYKKRKQWRSIPSLASYYDTVELGESDDVSFADGHGTWW